ncbi:hypothetical protein LWE61_11245 [Sphingobium sufflavum]|uniref:hypothetical protein n=1 Tax=Sphingobium sufflavum TaxID=1129547 RepID=UPI001F420D8D|nr:hypothetical protein [Sphingobium sufflavum]MCE7797133.1 hypothetical protein [Sphingobium sufflavum]
MAAGTSGGRSAVPLCVTPALALIATIAGTRARTTGGAMGGVSAVEGFGRT